MYQIIEVSIADVHRFLQYKQKTDFKAQFNLKGFDYLWILNSRQWKPEDRVLDVGCGYSLFPVYIADKLGCEVWAADNFDQGSENEFWKRGKEPQEHFQKYPQVKFVLELLGQPDSSSLPSGYFDCIYSASALEHVPPEFIGQVWRHMSDLLAKGGELIHAIEIRLPVHRGLISLVKAFMLDYLSFLIPPNYRLLNAFYTPKVYLRHVSRGLNMKIPARSNQLGSLRLALDPAIVLEPIDWAYNRMVKDGVQNFPATRLTSLLIHLKKEST
jgi:SAM-dependent methyltransferase